MAVTTLVAVLSVTMRAGAQQQPGGAPPRTGRGAAGPLAPAVEGTGGGGNRTAVAAAASAAPAVPGDRPGILTTPTPLPSPSPSPVVVRTVGDAGEDGSPSDIAAERVAARPVPVPTPPPPPATANAGESVAPAPAPAAAAPPIRRGPETAARDTSGATPPGPAHETGTARIAAALATVLGVIFVLRWGAKKFFPAVAGARVSRAVRVIGRTPLAPKQQVLLLQVGQRVLVVGDSGGALNCLCQIDDAEEIAALVGQVRAEGSPAGAAAFGSLIGRAAERFTGRDAPATLEDPHRPVRAGGPPDDPGPDVGLANTRDELTGLVDQVRRMRQQFDRK